MGATVRRLRPWTVMPTLTLILVNGSGSLYYRVRENIGEMNESR